MTGTPAPDPAPRRKRRRRTRPAPHPDLEADQREAEQRRAGHQCWIDALPPRERAAYEARVAPMREASATARSAQLARIAALRLSPLEAKLFQHLEGEEALADDGYPLGDRLGIDREELIESLYEVEWDALSRTQRWRLHGALRARVFSLNRKVAGEGLRVVRGYEGCIQLVRTEGGGEPRGGGSLPGRAEQEEYGAAESRNATDTRGEEYGEENLSAEEAKRLAEEYRAAFGGACPDGGRARRPRRDSPEGRKTHAECVAFLRAVLSAGQMPSRDLDRLCREQGYSTNAIRRARRALGVRAKKGAGYGADGNWFSFLPRDDARS